VDETLALFDDVVVPQFLKEIAYQVYHVATKQAPEAARAIVAETSAPGAKFSAQQYNQLATVLKEKHVPLSYFIPLVPIQRIEGATKIAQAG
ncbi:unnamed protein product, partial [Sphagnum jensenii]